VWPSLHGGHSLATVLGAGLVAVDHIFRTGKSVAKVGSIEYLGTSGGGSVGNALAMLSVLGHSAGVTGVVGDDIVANLVRADFGKLKVDSSHLIVRPGIRKGIRTRQFSHVVYPDGKHSFRDQCMQCGSPFKRETGLFATDLTRDLSTLAESCNLLHLDRTNEFTLKLAEKTLSKGTPISFDLAFKPYGEAEKNVNRMLSMATLVKVSEDLFTSMTGSPDKEGILEWRERYPNVTHLFVTRGSKGILGYCQVRNEKPTFQFPAIPPKPFHDGGGAGDVLVASLIDRFLLTPAPTVEKDAWSRINQAQALASLGCTVFGARSLAHVLHAEGLSPAQVWEIADQVVKNGVAQSRWSSKIGVPWKSSLGFLFGTNHACSVCGLARKEKGARKPKPRRLEYHVSLGQAPWAMSESYQIGRSHRPSLSAFRSRPTVFVGSGGSFSAATFAEHMVWHEYGKPSKAMPPYEFVTLPKLDPDAAIWLLSYGGANSDIIAAAERVRELKTSNCVVLTGAKNSQLAEMAREWKWRLIILPGQERSFVATVGMLAMVTAIAAILPEREEHAALDTFLDYPLLLDSFVNTDRIVREKAEQFPTELESIHIIGLSSGWGWPALVDFESKLVEGGLCTIEITELKNFTHGRYIGALERRKKNRLLILKTPENSELAEFIERKLHRHLGVFTLSTELAGPAGAIDLIVKVLFLSAHLARKAGKDISNPEYPPEARGLYGWVPSRRNALDSHDKANWSSGDE